MGKLKTIMRYLVGIVIVTSALAALSCSNDSDSHYEVANQNLLNFKDFYVSSNSTNLETSARGTIFVSKGTSDSYTAQIIAWVEIDSVDWGGVGFTIPFGWEVTNITSSYPNSSVNIATWETDDQESSKWHQTIEIGTSHTFIPHGGGKGCVIVDLNSTSMGPNPTDVMQIIVGVGCEERDGVKTKHPAWEIIEVPIVQYAQ